MAESIAFDAAAKERLVPIPIPEALAEPTRPKNVLFLIFFMIANMVIGVANIVVATTLLPEQIASLTRSGQTSLFALILGLGALGNLGK